MKKLLSILFLISMFSLPSFAVITPEESLSEQYLTNHGYSSETSRLVDLQRSQINGTKPTYQEKEAYWQTIKYPKWCKEKQINFIRRAFMYFDCGLDDGKFGRNSTEFTNRWDDL